MGNPQYGVIKIYVGHEFFRAHADGGDTVICMYG